MCRIFDWPRTILPVPVFLKRFAAPRCVFNLGMVSCYESAYLQHSPVYGNQPRLTSHNSGNGWAEVHCSRCSKRHQIEPSAKMSRPIKILALILGVVILIPISLFAALWIYSDVSSTPSKIVDFHPTNFPARADARFFYSIGPELKNSNEIDPKAPTLFRGQIRNFLVSPDNRKIAVAANGFLTIVGLEEPISKKVTPVDSIYREPKPIGRQFYRDDDFQWSRDSKSLYLIKDEYYASQGSQLYSSKGELWKYDVETGNMQLVLKPFPAYTYFFGSGNGLYFSAPTATGDLQLKHFDGNSVSDVDDPDAIKSADSPFFSFSIFDYLNIVPPTKDVDLVLDHNGEFEKLEIGKKPFLTLTRGEGLKGSYYCDEMLRSVFLPGDRYFLFNAPYCENYNGQLLLDSTTGAYSRLPPDTRVYLTLNTETDPRYHINVGGIVAH